MSGREVVVQVSHVSKSFGDRTVLDDVSLELLKGENLVILGKSGTGKSVLIKCIAGLMTPDRGGITVLGRTLGRLPQRKLSELKKSIGFCFQNSALYDSMNVRENLLFPLERAWGIRDEVIQKERVGEVLEDVGLTQAANMETSALSGGMRKRIGIARTLITRPEIVLYDEPTAGLDPATATEINLLISKMQIKYGMSSIIITHDLSCARTTSNRVLYLSNGKVVADGEFETLRAHPQDTVLSTFFKYYQL